MSGTVEKLAEVAKKLNERDYGFAMSLIKQSQRQALSDKQMYWVGRLINQVEGNVTSERVSIAENNIVDGLLELINRNNQAKYPAIRFLAGDKELKITRATERAQVPGSLNVVLVTPETHERIWYGRIHKNGEYEPSRKFHEERELVLKALRALAKDPEEAARDYGRKTGHCCFCALLLDDERSLLMGYGPVCAKNYKLKWGVRPEGK